MSLNKTKLFVVAGLSLLFSNVFAGSEDWIGNFVIKASNGREYNLSHTPSKVQFMFLSGGCLSLGKGSSINGFVMPADLNICTKDNVEVFTTEVSKLGKIINKKIELGPDYSK